MHAIYTPPIDNQRKYDLGEIVTLSINLGTASDPILLDASYIPDLIVRQDTADFCDSLEERIALTVSLVQLFLYTKVNTKRIVCHN